MNRLRQREIIRTTLGDLIAAVTDEVTAAFGDSPATYVVVSYIVADLLTRLGRLGGKRGEKTVRAEEESVERGGQGCCRSSRCRRPSDGAWCLTGTCFAERRGLSRSVAS